ncbi:UDP-glucuronic acid decarboxylase family protein [Phytoactinopolyspora halotolerans]|uniref:SDR family oxidoreductase n=1 Tax=Phytoactinopolyspora halotolerans TaxID=1981512 RepID=A0A6L9SGZ3_9ACTN|nr:UDP-glucuronic acid decarboxylase family protein [Phytoactinopolyspora halotolerans]NEE03914.1 SDR family oxidoreductase [Phytoactinopolyspora halotolerans]
MQTLVTGGAGFIGSHLVDVLISRGQRVMVVDDLSSGSLANISQHLGGGNLDFVEADICSELPLAGPFDVIFNLASSASPRYFVERPLETLMVGSIGVRNVIELAVQTNARLIQASTSEVYGEPEQHPQTESYWGNVNPIGPRSVYDESKRYAEAMIAAYVRLGRLDAGIVRIFNTYGPRLAASDGRVVSNFIDQSLRGLPLSIHGDGRQTRSFCYVDDLVRALLIFARRRERLGPVNLGNPQELTILELARAVTELTGAEDAIVHHPLPQDDPTQRRPDISRARELLGWEPEVSLRDGLSRTIEWFRSELDASRRQATELGTQEQVTEAGA